MSTQAVENLQPPESQPPRDALEAATDQAIAVCDDDPRAAVRALIIANGILEEQLREVYAATSRGYARGRMTKKGVKDSGSSR